jgi:hypothetical protein
MNIVTTKTGTFTLAALLIITGLLLDSSASAAAQVMHHFMFVLGGVAIGIGIEK